jgi:PAS domain S-box-containing protein
MLEVMRDVTSESRLEDELRRSHDMLASVLEGIGEGVVVVDRDYRILSANAAYLQQVHGERVEVIGEHCHKVSHHFDVPCAERGHDCPVSSVFKTGMPSQAMHTHYDHGGEPVYVEVRSYPPRDATGAVVRAIETLNDVTERVKLTEQVRESEEKYRDLYNSAPDGYYSIDGNGVIVEVNRTFLDMTGYTREEIAGKMCIDTLLAPGATVHHTMLPGSNRPAGSATLAR